MKPQLFALLTAIAWGVGGYFEKKGLHMGNLSPQMGITIRTFVALILLGIISTPYWKTVPQMGTQSFLYIVIGGGVVAGTIGMVSFYAAIKGAPLSQIMPIAFTSPLFGAFMGIVFGGEPLTIKTIAGALFTVVGIVLLTI